MPTINISIERIIADSLARKGYARLDKRFFGAHDPDLKIACEAFVDSCHNLPIDDYQADGSRCRRYGGFVLFPWSWHIEPIPPVWDSKRDRLVSRYIQSIHFNPEHGDKIRSFAPLTKEQAKSPFLRHAILTSFRSLPWKLENQPVAVGCHLIELVATPGKPAASSPDAVHQDGEPYTFAALIERRGAIGGENLITTTEVANKHPSQVSKSQIIERFTLESQWDGWVVDDTKVAHYVSPIEVVSGHNAGRRVVLLIDFTPLIPDIKRH